MHVRTTSPDHRRSSMKKILIPVMLVAAAATLAACGGGGGGDATATPATGANAISAEDIGGAGVVLVDSSGQALYASDQEKAAGKVLCTGACNSFWEPLTASGNVTSSGSVPGKLGTVERPDGGMQVTYNGDPLYTFTQDQPGEVTGDGFKDAFDGQQFTWHAVTVSGSGSTSNGGSGSTSSSGGGSGYSY
jgi:predicted lipoprotein with Yx(FWY)xxD motif